MMHSLSRKLGFQFECMKSVEAEGLEVSSSSVRELIDAGEFTKAAACLGRPFTFFSQVIAGKGLGRQIGFPTANLDTASQMMPPRGVYAVKARKVCVLPAEDALFGDCIHLKSQAAPDWMPGVMNYGCRPTVSSVQELCAEIHFPKFSGNLLGETLEVLIIKRVRDEIKFDTVADLKRQIEKDILVSQSWA